MAQDKITAKQQEILEYIKETILKKGYPPAVREICEAVHLKTTSSVHSHLSALEEKGYIRRDPTKPRTIEILDDTFNFNRREMANVPLVGAVAAGQPHSGGTEHRRLFPHPRGDCFPTRTPSCSSVKGDSMINAGILDGRPDHCGADPLRPERRYRGGSAGGFRHGEAFLQGGRPLPPAARERLHGPHHRGSCRHSGKGHRALPPDEIKPCPLPFKGATPAGLYSAGSPARAAAQSPAACFLPIKSPASGRKPDHSQRCAQFPPVAGLFYSNTREPPDKPAACRVSYSLFVSYSSFTSTKVLPSRQIRSRS